MNAKLIKELSALQQYAEIRGDPYREKAYRIAIQNIRALDYKITSDTLQPIPGVGKGIGAKIVEWCKTHKISELEKLKKDPIMRAHAAFSKILGVGPAAANGFIKSGISTISQLKKAVADNKITLNRMQALGLKYYKDLNERIPRAEITAIGRKLRHALLTIDPNLYFEISGSYRRGAATSGDIDIIISSRRANILEQFRATIAPEDIISAGSARLTFLYHGEKVRQVDLLYTTPDKFAPAVLYFTGNGNFNEYMRGVAKKKGLRLNQLGLFTKSGNAIPAASERDIFDALSIPYVAPAKRNF